GYFDSVTVFIIFAGCALFSAMVLIPYWNSRPAGLRNETACVPNRPMSIKPLRT
ncbi:MAG: transporter, partial [Pseudomonas sp.]|nr:transporter [Pseudomonas sp.]